jgi:putative FmdB family regulatory protein
MPTYEYVCAKCGHEFEKFQPIADKALTTCLKDLCGQKKWGKGKVQRKITAGAGLIFKGSGFYITDYRSDNYKESAKKEKEASTPAAATPASSETKSKGTESSPSKGAESKPGKSPESSPSKGSEGRPGKSGIKPAKKD